MACSVPHSHIPYGPSGSGHYGKWSANQNISDTVILKEKILNYLDSLMANEDNTHGSVFTMADLGTADGAVSMPLIRDVIDFVRKKRVGIPVQVIYNDQASSDFNSVFRRVHGLIPDPPSYLREFQDVFVMASGTSFYEQIMPDNTADLIMSFMAAHWLSTPATTYEDTLYPLFDASEAEMKLVAAQGAMDWERFLLHRARELKPGGLLLLAVPSKDCTRSRNGIALGGESILNAMVKVWRQMRDEARITKEEFVDTNVHVYLRSKKELMAPFEDENGAVRKAGLTLLDIDQFLVPCTTTTAWQEKLDKEGIDDRQTWAKTLVNIHRCWSNSTFIRGLASTRSEEEKEALVDEMYARLEAEIASHDPREFNNCYMPCAVFAQKKSRNISRTQVERDTKHGI